MTFKQRVRVSLAIVLALLVQETVVPQTKVLGVFPDVVLAVVSAGGMLGGSMNGAIIGFWAGFATDLFLTTPFGLSSLVFTLVGYGTGSLETLATSGSKAIVASIVSVASAVGVVGYATLSALVGVGGTFSNHLIRTVVVVSLVNFAIAPVAARLVRWTGIAETERTARYGAS